MPPLMVRMAQFFRKGDRVCGTKTVFHSQLTGLCRGIYNLTAMRQKKQEEPTNEITEIRAVPTHIDLHIKFNYPPLERSSYQYF